MIKISKRDRPIFIMTIGISGSGKSSWLKDMSDFEIVCPDTIREELTGNVSDQSQNAEVWKIAKQRVSESLQNGKNVILDATNVDSGQRISFIKGLPENTLKAKIFNVDVEEAVRRVNEAIQKGKNRSNVPEHIIRKQHEKFKTQSTEEKLREEGFELI